MSKAYRIGELSRITGIKEGTIRFYEKCGFIGPVERASNNYRIYRERHIFQLRVCRLVFGGYVNKRLRSESMKVLYASAGWDVSAYARESAGYQRAIEEDIERTRRAVSVCMEQMGREEKGETKYSRKQAADMAGVTPETVRSWERNGLLGSYEPYQRRLYGQTLLDRMYVIRLLLDTGYSMMTIRSFMQEYDEGQTEGAKQLLISPREREELCQLSDRYMEALEDLHQKALELKEMKSEMEKI